MVHQQRNKRKHLILNPPASCSFDDLCDNTLLRILSYTDDLRSLIHLTRCTSKSLRKRFDIKGDNNAPEYSEQYKRFWMGVLVDLQMTPLEESDSKSQDYIAAINYRLSIFNTLIGHEKRRKAGTKRSYSISLCQQYFKPLDYASAWYHYDGNEVDNEEVDIASPFGLISRGTGHEFVMVNPDSGSIEVHNDIMERGECRDNSIQEKHAIPTTSIIKPSQVLLSSYRYSIKEENGPLNRNWNDYFGDNTPFGPYDVSPTEDVRRIHIEEVSVVNYDSMDDAGIVLKEKRIVLYRLMRDQGGNFCTEYIVWGDSGYNERSLSKRFELKTIIRIPTLVWDEDVWSYDGGDELFCVLDEDPYGLLSEQVGENRFVCQFSLSPNIEEEQQYYVQPETYFMTDNKATMVYPIGRHQLLIGTNIGTIEMWDCSDKSAPNRLTSFHAIDTFPSTIGHHDIRSLVHGCGKLQNLFLSAQRKVMTVAITLWQRSQEDFQKMIRIKYKYLIDFSCNDGRSVMILACDELGYLYFDIYHLLGSRYVVNEFDDVDLPEDVEITSLLPGGERLIKFANRINIDHRVSFDTQNRVKDFAIDWNDRFIVIEAPAGVIDSKGGENKSGPGLIVIDLDENASSLLHSSRN